MAGFIPLGIPALLNPASFTRLVLMRQDGAGIRQREQAKPFWGILLNGRPVLQADTILSFEFRNSWRLSTFPQEQGAFQSYNKVTSPYEARLTFTRGGTEADRAQFLQAIDDIANSLDLYDIITPERPYHNANIYDYNLIRRTESGVGLISVEVLLQEVRVTATTQFSRDAPESEVVAGSQPSVLLVGPQAPGAVGVPAAPSGFSPSHLGTIQATPPTPSQTTNLNVHH